MSLVTNGFIAGSVVAGGLMLRRLLNIGTLANRLITVIELGRVRLEGASLAIEVKATLKNASSGSLPVRQPMVLLYQGQQQVDNRSPLASSDPSSQMHRIPANGSLALPPIKLVITPLAGLALIRQYLGGQPMELIIVTYSQVGGLIPTRMQQKVTLRAA